MQERQGPRPNQSTPTSGLSTGPPERAHPSAVVESPCAPRSRHPDQMAMSAKAPMAPAPSLEEAWRICADLFSDLPTPTLMPGSADSEHELLFCLLGGFGVSYEHNRSAVEVIAPLEPFGSCRADE